MLLAEKTNKNKQGGKEFAEPQHFGGKAQILRVAQSGEVWQFRMWIAAEKKYLRKSLQTEDIEAAKDRGRKTLPQNCGKCFFWEKNSSGVLQELTDLYTEWRKEDVGTKDYERSFSYYSIQMKHVLGYKGADLKIGELERNSFYDYENWRKQTKPGTQNVTIRNEQSTINHMMNFAYREGYTLSQLDFRPINA